MVAGSLRFVAHQDGQRVDRLVADATGQGRRGVRLLLAGGRVRVGGRIARRGSELAPQGSEIVVEYTELPVGSPSLDWRVILDTGRLLVIDKPAGLHCERGRSASSLAELLTQRFDDLTSVGERAAEAGLVHRLDRDTSGVIVAARRREEYRRLRRAFRAGLVRKQYLALAAARLRAPIEIETPLARRRGRMAAASAHEIATGEALPAITRLEPLDGGGQWTLVLATMRTGVMHQVRVHLATAGHPLFGDELYGGTKLAAATRSGQLLHAWRITVADELDVTCGPPQDFLAAYAQLRRGGN